MSHYFDNEMRLFQEAAHEFSQAFPDKARMLNLSDVKDRDPYVERLFEGMAFLTAEVKQRLDDDIPEISEALLSHVRPYFLRPFPSCCIMEFKPRPGQLRQATLLPKGTRLTGPPLSLTDGTSREIDERINCRFRTCNDVTLHPLRLNGFRIENPPEGGQSLVFHFQLDHGVTADHLDLEQLKIYLHGDQATATALYYAMTAGVEDVAVTYPGLAIRPSRLGGQEALVPCHLDLDNLLIPSSGRSFLGFHLLQEYFCFREKYQFVSITNFGAVAWPEKCAEFEVRVRMRRQLPEDFRLTRDNFRLYCATAVNLFPMTSEPIELTHHQREYPVVADHNHPAGMMIYSVDSVTGTDPHTGQRSGYSPLPKFNHLQGNSRFYHVSHRLREGRRPITVLGLGGTLKETKEVLSCDITACNGNIPQEHLQIGDIQAPPQGFPSNITCENITRPSRMLLPPNRSDYRLALMSHLTVSYNSLASVDSLRQLLMLYDWSEREQSAKRITGITGVTTSPASRVHRGALYRGMTVHLQMNEADYISDADAFLFGTVLHHFFGMYASINAFIQTGSELSPSKREMQWDPKLGENFLI